jgi:hypothetical protein
MFLWFTSIKKSIYTPSLFLQRSENHTHNSIAILRQSNDQHLSFDDSCEVEGGLCVASRWLCVERSMSPKLATQQRSEARVRSSDGRT